MANAGTRARRSPAPGRRLPLTPGPGGRHTLGAVLAALGLGLSGAAGAAGLELAGDRRQGGLLRGQVPPGSQVHFNGRPLQVGSRGFFAAGLGRDAPPRLPLTWRDPGGGLHRRVVEVAQRHYGTQRINGLPDRLVHPDAKALERIRREQARLRQARNRFTELAAYRDRFRWPLEGRVTGVYGTRRILNGEPRQPHFGVDIAAPVGTPVQAPAGGIVRLAAPDLYFSGGTLVLDHGHGVTSTFLHISRFRVATGDQVERGERIAEVGATGRVTGPHLDWRMNWLEKRLDPALLAGPPPGNRSPTAGRME